MKKQGPDHPPSFFFRLLRWFCPAQLIEEIEGDLVQRFHRDVWVFGPRKAKRRMLWNTIRFFRLGIIFRNKVQIHSNSNLMLSHYLRVALRNIGRNKGFAAVNFAGLGMGITCTVLILLWVQNELSYDRFHPEADRLFEAWNRENVNGGVRCWNTTPRVLASTLVAEYPEVEQAISYADYQIEFLVTSGDLKFTDASGVITSTPFLSMFNFPLLAGNARSALDEPFSIVLTEQFARRIFGTAQALGKTVSFKYAGQALDFKVTGVLKDLPNNTQFDFGYLLSWELMRAMGETDTFWGNNSLSTFVRLKKGTSVDAFNKKVADIAIRHSGGGSKNEVFLYPVSQLRLYSKFVNGVAAGGRIEVVRLFEVIAVLILLISCINFMNLTTARCENRAREVGVRKTVGAPQRTLIAQFLTESLLTSILSAVIALVAIHLLLPAFNTMTEKQLVIDYSDPGYWIGVGGVTLFAGVFAGSYPSFFLSSFRPIKVLKGNYISSLSGAAVRKALVIFQFSFTIILVMATLVVRDQINYAQQRETGFLQGNLIYLTLNADLAKNYTVFRHELIQSGFAVSTSKTFSPITEQWSATDQLEWQGKDPGNRIIFDRYAADEDLVATAGLELLAGRDIDVSRFPSDSSAALINETAARVMNFKDPIGESFKDSGKEWTIVGVFRDFIARSPYQKAWPMVVEGAGSGWFYAMHIRLTDQKPLAEALAATRSIFQKYDPEHPFEYHFADVEYERKFNDEKRTQKLSTASAGLAILISCLGVFGLSMHMTQRRTKEIGVRKVFGASVVNVLTLLSKEPLKLTSIAFVLASPAGYWAMQQWLQRYEYKIDVGWQVFAATIIGILLITFVTTSLQTIRSALRNPVQALRHE